MADNLRIQIEWGGVWGQLSDYVVPCRRDYGVDVELGAARERLTFRVSFRGLPKPSGEFRQGSAEIGYALTHGADAIARFHKRDCLCGAWVPVSDCWRLFCCLLRRFWFSGWPEPLERRSGRKCAIISVMTATTANGIRRQMRCNLCGKFLDCRTPAGDAHSIRMHELGVGRHQDELKVRGLPLDSRSFGYTLWIDGIEQK